jgi:hypothetical protein
MNPHGAAVPSACQVGSNPTYAQTCLAEYKPYMFAHVAAVVLRCLTNGHCGAATQPLQSSMV